MCEPRVVRCSHGSGLRESRVLVSVFSLPLHSVFRSLLRDSRSFFCVPFHLFLPLPKHSCSVYAPWCTVSLCTLCVSVNSCRKAKEKKKPVKAKSRRERPSLLLP